MGKTPEQETDCSGIRGRFRVAHAGLRAIRAAAQWRVRKIARLVPRREAAECDFGDVLLAPLLIGTSLPRVHRIGL